MAERGGRREAGAVAGDGDVFGGTAAGGRRRGDFDYVRLFFSAAFVLRALLGQDGALVRAHFRVVDHADGLQVFFHDGTQLGDQ